MILFDSHCHSSHSTDAFNTPDEIAAAAAANGIAGFCLTDHCDCNVWSKNEYPAAFRNGYRDIRRIRERLGDTLMISFGIELGQPLGYEDNARLILSLAEYDFVLLSLHNARVSTDLYELPMGQMTKRELLDLSEGYFQFVLDSVREWDDWDSLAHLTLPARYINRRCSFTLDLRRYDDIIDNILKEIVRRGRGLEINMSGLRNTHGESMPPLWILERFYELGGEIITIGSDTHKAEMVGVFVDNGMRLAYEAGFRRVAFYRKREPVFFEIEKG